MDFVPYSSAEYEILPATHGLAIRTVVACWRLFAAFWAILATVLVVGAIIAPPVLFALAAVHGKNPFQQRFLLPLASSALAVVAFVFGFAAIRAYALLVSPTRLIALRFLAVRDLLSGIVFSIVGAVMWPEKSGHGVLLKGETNREKKKLQY